MSGNPRVALVHDDFIQHGGAERLFEAMLEIWPEADIFTSMATREWEGRLRGEELQGYKESPRKLATSFMQKLPFKKKLYRHYFPLYPFAFESFDLSGYDLVISSSTRFAHGVITRPETCHICYMNSPGRMIWEPQTYFRSRLRESRLRYCEDRPADRSATKGDHEGRSYAFSPLHLATSPFLSYLRLWDYQAAQRVDYFIANSKTPAARIKKYYGRDVEVVYPFVDLARFQVNSKLKTQNSGQYFLIVSRLAAWKRIDVAVEACNQLQVPLKIIGEGPDRKRLERLAGSTVELLGRLPDEDVVDYYRGCKAFLFPQEEDFGITPLEAMASGKSVIAYGVGGALETITPGQTGEFFCPQTAEALVSVMRSFDPAIYSSRDCQNQAQVFSKERFQENLARVVGEFSSSHRERV